MTSGPGLPLAGGALGHLGLGLENSGGRVLKAAPEELKEKYRHVFA